MKCIPRQVLGVFTEEVENQVQIVNKLFFLALLCDWGSKQIEIYRKMGGQKWWEKIDKLGILVMIIRDLWD